MRYALGARRSRIVSQLMIEGGGLGLAGAVPEFALAPMVATSLVRILTNSDPGTEPYSASVDTRVLLFTLGLSVLATLFFSIAPVFHFLRPDLAGALRQNAGTLSKDSQRFRKLAVGVQIALSVCCSAAPVFSSAHSIICGTSRSASRRQSRHVLPRSHEFRLRRGSHRPDRDRLDRGLAPNSRRGLGRGQPPIRS